MKEKDVVAQIISEIDDETDGDVGVRTVGDDQNISPPEVVVEWSSSRLDGYNGHHPRGGYITDAEGDKTGYELHLYYRMTADCLARSYDEEEVTDILNTLQDHFSVYEYRSAAFDADTGRWSIGDVTTRGNAVIEPDWYEVGLPLRFDYLRRVARTSDYDTLKTIEQDISGNSDTLEDGETIIG